MNKKIIVAALLASGLFAGTASADTVTSTMAVSATVNAGCLIDSVGTMNFGTYVATLGSKTATADIAVSCANTLAYNVGLDAGLTAGSQVSQRLLNDGAAHTVQYNLYTDGAYTTIWGDVIGTDTVAGTGSGNSQILTVYGRMPDNGTNQTAPAGNYSDTVTVTVTY